MQTTDVVSRRMLCAHSRVLVKTACYRVFMFLITAITVFVVTGSLAEALSIGLATNLLKTITYYGYERLWAHVSWGVDAE